jgi:transcriptional regulator with XRE-family HTH domain
MESDMERADTLLEGLIREDQAALKLWEERRPRARLSAALLRVRRGLKLTQSDVARKMGLEQSNIARIEGAQGAAQTTEALIRYANACGLTLGIVFLNREDNRYTIVDGAAIDGNPQADELFRSLIEQSKRKAAAAAA